MVAGSGNTGGVVSTTRATKLVGVAWLPAASFAVHVTSVSPSGNKEPEAGAHVTASVPSTLSVAVGAAHETAAPLGPTASLTIVPGVFAMIGPVVSTTLTVNPDVAMLPAWSVAEQFTGVLPSGNWLPDAGAQLTGSVTSTMSPAVGFV